MKAIVLGDIPLDGRMFSCGDCHQRSGLGSVEGTVITWPTTGRELYKPRRRTGAWRAPDTGEGKGEPRKELPTYWQVKNVRPAYTDETLAHMLRTGVDPEGRRLNAIMPRYILDDREMAILIHYLKNLSAEQAPGVDDTTIRFATVITEEVPRDDRKAMLSVVQAHIDAHNAQGRHEERRAKSGPFYKSERHQAYRRLKLNIWELKGTGETWRSQLEEYYRQEPVFAILGGITTGSWAPIHEFSEQHRIPSLFPITELPVVSESDWYTLYFSKGLYQEGETVAKYLHISRKTAPDVKIVQVFRKGQKSAALAQGFGKTWEKFRRKAPENFELGKGQELNERFWKEIRESQGPEVLLLWLESDDLVHIESLVQASTRPFMVFVSSSLLGDLSIIPDTMRETVYLTYPYSLPGENDRRLDVVKRWLKTRKIPLTNMEVQSRMYFLGWMLPAGIKHMRSEFYREYFLEGFEMMIDQDYAIAVYPRLTFGPGQRYASKGCYIVQLTDGPHSKIVKKSEWVIH
jgi:hypothetical protein